MSVKDKEMRLKLTRTARGFELINFLDLYGEECSLQQSSLAERNAIWLGCDHETKHVVTGEPCGARMHLDRKQVSQLIRVLQRWVKTGSFK